MLAQCYKECGGDLQVGRSVQDLGRHRSEDFGLAEDLAMQYEKGHPCGR
jgi:hypothetical protein